MLKKEELPDCPVATTVQLIGNKWKLLILRHHLSQFSASSAGILYTLITINPLTTIIGSYRNAFMYHQWPDFKSLGLVFVFSLVVLGIGYMIFKKLEKGFAEEL